LSFDDETAASFDRLAQMTAGAGLFLAGRELPPESITCQLIPAFRTLPEETLQQNPKVSDLEIDHDFPGIGQKKMTLNPRWLDNQDPKNGLILILIGDRWRFLISLLRLTTGVSCRRDSWDPRRFFSAGKRNNRHLFVSSVRGRVIAFEVSNEIRRAVRICIAQKSAETCEHRMPRT
jgi:hypothetical protein